MQEIFLDGTSCDTKLKCLPTRFAVMASAFNPFLMTKLIGQCAIVLDLLGDLGYKTLTAPDGPSGLAILEIGLKIDLLITDVGLEPDRPRLTRQTGQPRTIAL